MSQLQPYVDALVSNIRFGKFLSVGFVGMLVDMSILTLLVELGSLTPTLGKVCSAEISIMVMFVLNERWTFNDLGDQNESTLRRFVRSNIVRGTGAAVALTTLYVLTTVFDVWYLLANAIGIGIGVVFNYTFETLITWRIHQSDTNG